MISKRAQRTCLGTMSALWMTAVAGLLGDLFRESHIVELTEIGLASFGAVFAFLAMLDAHNAFLKAEKVEEAVGSFRMSFQDVMGEMVSMCRNAKGKLSILIPTPGYGYLFGEMEQSRMFVDELEEFLRRNGTFLELFLVVGDPSRPDKELIPQRYLQRAFELEGKKRVNADDYTALVSKVFSCISTYKAKAKLKLLNSDPNVRLMLADVDNPENRACLLSFAQADPDNVETEFKSTGFKSTHSYMVNAVRDLLLVYADELRRGPPILPLDNIESLYVMVR